jgi:hypothetical protein
MASTRFLCKTGLNSGAVPVIQAAQWDANRIATRDHGQNYWQAQGAGDEKAQADPLCAKPEVAAGIAARRRLIIQAVRLSKKLFAPLERFSVDVNRDNKGVPKGAQIRFGLL